MITNTNEALIMVIVMGIVILLCRALPFLLFGSGAGKFPHLSSPGFLAFIEKTVPPAAMTVLAFNSIAISFRDNAGSGALVLAAAVFTAFLHIIQKNPLISIFGGTAAYILIERFFV